MFDHIERADLASVQGDMINPALLGDGSNKDADVARPTFYLSNHSSETM